MKSVYRSGEISIWVEACFGEALYAKALKCPIVPHEGIEAGGLLGVLEIWIGVSSTFFGDLIGLGSLRGGISFLLPLSRCRMGV